MLQKRLGQQREEVHTEQRLDPAHLLQEDRGDHEVRLQLGKPFLDHRLLLVGKQQVHGRHRRLVRYQREDTIEPRLFNQSVVVDPPGQIVPGGFAADVSRLGRALLDFHDEERFEVGVAENGFVRLRYLGWIAESAPRGRKFDAQLGQCRSRPFQAFVPLQRVAFGLAVAVVVERFLQKSYVGMP